MESSDVEHFDKLWVVGLPEAVFSNHSENDLRFELEATFEEYEVQDFQYLKGLRRVLVTCLSREHAELALERLGTFEFQGTTVHVQAVEPVTIGPLRLSLPERTRQFLISPPASPPVGWEPGHEPPPVLDPDLLRSSLSQFKGGPHEVLPGSRSIPSIVVTPYMGIDEEIDYQSEGGVGTYSGHEQAVKISTLPAVLVHTARPPMND